MDFGVAGEESGGLAIVEDGLGVVLASDLADPRDGMGEGVIFGDGDGVFEEGSGIGPEEELLGGGGGEEPESGAEEIFAFGDPGDGFDIDGVDGEEEGDGETGPGIAGEALPDEEDEEGVEGVEDEIGEMMEGGVGAEEGDIEHVGEPGEGDPLGGDEVGEG